MNERSINTHGVVSMLPILLGIIISIWGIVSFIDLAVALELHTTDQLQTDPDKIVKQLAPFTIFTIIASVVSLGILIYFMVLCIKDTSATENDKLIWTLVLLFFNAIALPIFWYFRMKNNTSFGIDDRVTDRTN